MIGPSVKTLMSRLGIDSEQAATCRKILAGDFVPSDHLADAPPHYYSRDVRLKLRCLDAVIGGFGVETIESLDPDKNILYVNMGDSYTNTITYRKGAFRAECWGDVVERDSSYV